MINYGTITTNTKLSETQYYSVLKKTNSGLTLINDFGEEIEVDKDYAEKCLVSSDQVDEEKKLTRTELAALFIGNPGVVMKVNFNKQVDKAAVKKEVEALYPNKGGKILSEVEYVKKVNALLKTALEGEERTMVGRHNGIVNEFGRVQFIDMEKDKGISPTHDGRQSQVDPRTINWLIIRGTKYIKK